MCRRPPRSTRTYTLFPDTTRVLSLAKHRIHARSQGPTLRKYPHLLFYLLRFKFGLLDVNLLIGPDQLPAIFRLQGPFRQIRLRLVGRFRNLSQRFAPARPEIEGHRRPVELLDRKSTRLNSSH